MSGRIQVAVEVGAKKAFATAIDWPGWSRSGRTVDLALEALAASAPRYAPVAAAAGEAMAGEAGDVASFAIVERANGGAGTDFGVPSRVTQSDRRSLDAAAADRLRRLVESAWEAFDQVAATAPAELRKGPRGGGRDRDRMVDHVLESDHAYAREIGLRIAAPTRADPGSIETMRSAILDVLGQPSDGSPLGGRNWPPRYAAARIAWHALDHAWEMEDRTEPD